MSTVYIRRELSYQAVQFSGSIIKIGRALIAGGIVEGSKVKVDEKDGQLSIEVK